MADRGARRSSGLFRRIYLTFLVTVVVSAAAAGVGAYLLARSLSRDWVGDTLQLLAERNDELVDALPDPKRIEPTLSEIEDELRTHLTIYDAEGNRVAGKGSPRISKRAHRFSRQLRRGRPLVHHRNHMHPPLVLVPLIDPLANQMVAVVHVRPPRRPPFLPLGISATFLLGALGLGAWVLSRSLTQRLAGLEHSADRIAKGELGHRVSVPQQPTDELDELGHAFNEMARKVQALVLGQQSLLTNVSHELRTPIARIEVLLEILQERAESIAAKTGAEQTTHLQRLRDGLAEMQMDTAEIEKLIADLLTSGRLELRADKGEALDRAPVRLTELAQRVGDRHAADVSIPDDLVVNGDALLLERLLSNLLSNARRACPDGRIEVAARVDGEEVVLTVQDEGPGVPAERRERIFQPFTRLDDARSRDLGGVGLGLHLCRQISRAHGGSIRVTDRPDGRVGACFVVRLPHHVQ